MIKKNKNAQNRKQNVYFLMRICKHDVISDTRLFSDFTEEYPDFLSGINFRISQTNCVLNKSSTVSYSLY